MQTSSLERKDPDVFWLHVRLFVKVEFAVYSLSFELMFMNDNIQSSQSIITIGIETPFRCHFKPLWKKRNIIVTFQSGQLT